MRAVFKKEWLQNFRTLTGWIFWSLTLFFMGWYFRYYGLVKGLPYISYIINAVTFIFIMTLPLLTMRSFAEEKRHKTDQLLYTSPVSLRSIVLGKYLAALCAFLPLNIMFALYPLILGVYGPVPVAENVLAAVGFTLFVMAALAVGMLISALTDNQITAAVLTFFTLLLSAMVKSISGMISVSGNAVTSVLKLLDLTAPFEYSMYGSLDWPSVVYLLTVTALALFFTEYVLDAGRHSVRTMGLPGAVANLLKAALAIALAIAVNAGVRMLPPTVRSLDLTYNSIRSLSWESLDYLSKLDTPVQIFVLSPENERDETVAATLDRIVEINGNVRVSYVSPNDYPYFYMNYTDTEPGPGSLIVTSGGRNRVIDYYDCYRISYDYVYDIESESYVAADHRVSGYDGEGRIMAAISYVSSGDIPKIYAITGHEELECDEELKGRINNAGYELESINLLRYDEVPEDGDVIFISGPFADLNGEDMEKIRRFLDKGRGAVFVTAYREGVELPNYYSLFEDFGIKVLPGVVYEEDPGYINESRISLLPEVLDTEISRSEYAAGRTRYIYMPFAKGFRLIEKADVSAYSFLRTTESAHTAEVETEEAGPLSLAVFARRHGETGDTRPCAFASDYFLYRDINQAVNGGNYELFIKALGAVSEKPEQPDIPVKAYEYDPVLVDSGARNVFSMLLIGVIPSGLLLCGIFIWILRRRNQG